MMTKNLFFFLLKLFFHSFSSTFLLKDWFFCCWVLIFWPCRRSLKYKMEFATFCKQGRTGLFQSLTFNHYGPKTKRKSRICYLNGIPIIILIRNPWSSTLVDRTSWLDLIKILQVDDRGILPEYLKSRILGVF